MAVVPSDDYLSEEDRKTLIGMTEKELIRCHWALGRRIRNCFGMWNYNVELLESCGSSPPDEASMAIIKAVWRTLKNDIGTKRIEGVKHDTL